MAKTCRENPAQCVPIGGHECTTLVIFRVDRRPPHDVYALLPEIPASPGCVTSYQHIGQHGAADYGHCIATSRPATPEEYADLAAELRQIGYSLDIRQRWQRRRA